MSSAFLGVRRAIEVVVVADESVPPDWAALDIIVQAEHGPDGFAWLITWSEDVAEKYESPSRSWSNDRRHERTRSPRSTWVGSSCSSTARMKRSLSPTQIAPRASGADGRRSGVAPCARSQRRVGLSRGVRTRVGRRLHRRSESRDSDLRFGALRARSASRTSCVGRTPSR